MRLVAILAWVVLVWPPHLWAQSGVDQAEIAEVLTELDEAGAPATTEEIAAFLAEASAGSSTGVLLGRSGWTGAAGLEHTARLRLNRDWLVVRARWRQYADGETQVGGAVIVGPERWRLAVGQLGLAQGFGMFAGGPGRGPSITADGSLAARDRGLVPWTGAAAPQGVLGVAAEVERGFWRVRVLAGERGAEPAADQPSVVTQFSCGSRNWRLSGLWLSDPAEQGVSLAGRLQSGALKTTWEAVWRKPVGSVVPLGALLVQAGWRPHHKVRLEVLGGWADPGPRPVMGQKHPLFGEWGGRGAAVRGTWRAVSGLGLKIMVHRGRGREPVAAGRLPLRTLTDALLTRTWPGGWSAVARWRAGGEQVSTWSERFPWQPPVRAWQDSRRVLSLKGQWRGEQGRGQVLWRQLDLARVRQDVGWESGGTRSLVALSMAVNWGRSARVRAAWTLSWGDPVDLVSAVVPFAGYVLPRHWGHWRAERLVGLEWRRGRFQARAALSWRQAEIPFDGAPAEDVQAGWLEAAWAW